MAVSDMAMAVAGVDTANDVKLAKLGYQLELYRSDLAGSRAKSLALGRELTRERAKLEEADPDVPGLLADALYATRNELDQVLVALGETADARKGLEVAMSEVRKAYDEAYPGEGESYRGGHRGKGGTRAPFQLPTVKSFAKSDYRMSIRTASQRRIEEFKTEMSDIERGLSRRGMYEEFSMQQHGRARMAHLGLPLSIEEYRTMPIALLEAEAAREELLIGTGANPNWIGTGARSASGIA